jgi:hypothetical protein
MELVNVGPEKIHADPERAVINSACFYDALAFPRK